MQKWRDLRNDRERIVSGYSLRSCITHVQFEITAELNGLNEQQKAAYLAKSRRGLLTAVKLAGNW